VIDAIFAGMPRSTVWPADAAEPPPTAPTLFDRDPEPLTPVVGTLPGHARPVERQPATGAAAPMTLGLWDTDEGSEPAGVAQPDPADELEAGRAALVAGHIDEASLHFGLALRLAPALAPAVLEATDGVRGPELILVRGDAYRLAGHETEAQQAYAIAAQGGLLERRKTPRNPPTTLMEEPTRPPRATDAADSQEPPPAEPAEPAPAAMDHAPAVPEPAAAAAEAPSAVPVVPDTAAPAPDPGHATTDVVPPPSATDDAPPPATATNGSSTTRSAAKATAAKPAAAAPAPAEAPIVEAVTPDGAPD
jgi:hypothetical protein